MPDNGVILVVTDAGTKQHDLEESIRQKSLEKNINSMSDGAEEDVGEDYDENELK